MGCCCGTSYVEPTDGARYQPEQSVATKPDICPICGSNGQRKVVSWWCDDCKHYICNLCAWNHSNYQNTRSHSLVPVSTLPIPHPSMPAWVKQQEHKQALLLVNFDTRADLHYVETHGESHWNHTDGQEHERHRYLLPLVTGMCCPKRLITQSAAVITACTFISGGYIVVADYLHEQVKLFDSQLICKSYLKLEGNNPCDMCNHGADVYVTVENKCEIYVLHVTFPYLCFGRKLKHKEIITTEGCCDSIAVCRASASFHGLVVGMTFSGNDHTKKYQVQIMTLKGKVLKMLFNDDTGQTLFHGKVFVSGSPKNGEIFVTDKQGDSVQGFNTITGEGLFKHNVTQPLGITVDNRNNIYVISNLCFYWIPPHRETLEILLKRGHRSRSHNCCYDTNTQMLAVTSSHSETVQFFKITKYNINSETTD